MYDFEPIGVIRSPFSEPAGVPIQSAVAGDARGQVVVFDRFAEGLTDLEGFDRIWLVYVFDRGGPQRLRVTPFRDVKQRGLFSTRAPCRPNPIGLSPVRLQSIRGTTLEVSGLDVVDGTPLLDIKPYVPEFDSFPDSRAGWLDRGATDRNNADGRFVRPD
jgi:tRNA-Thr(GGU) m(6)t(6)A37 methyltransferase TsaA